MPDSPSVAIIQGRMGSSRLPGKVLLEIAGKPMLQHVVERARRAHHLDAVLVATSTDTSDDPIADFCASFDVPCARGSLHDVLDRFYQAALSQAAGRIVRITADCPMIDPSLIDATLDLVGSPGPHGPVDFAANRLPPPFGRSFPIGLDVEACSMAALHRAWREGTQTFHREHVMPFLYEGATFASDAGQAPDASIAFGLSSRGFAIAQLHHTPAYGSQRWTVDTPADLEFARQVFARLADQPEFTWLDVLAVLQKEPGLTLINAGIRHKTMTEVDDRGKQP